MEADRPKKIYIITGRALKANDIPILQSNVTILKSLEAFSIVIYNLLSLAQIQTRENNVLQYALGQIEFIIFDPNVPDYNPNGSMEFFLFMYKTITSCGLNPHKKLMGLSDEPIDIAVQLGLEVLTYERLLNLENEDLFTKELAAYNDLPQI